MSSTSRLLTRTLRHDPAILGLNLEPGGWVRVDLLLTALRRHGRRTTKDELDAIVAADDKGRLGYSDDGKRIRAAQGHSIEVDLGLKQLVPPPILYHGTARASLDLIFAEGLKPMGRRQVHLSRDVPTALKVGRRHGRPVVLQVEAGALHDAGTPFFQADNGVWLVEAVPPSALSFTTM